MPDVPYKQPGEDLDAAGMNVLTAEADRRASLALDNHSLIYLIGTNRTATLSAFRSFMGPRFIWKSDGTKTLSDWFGSWSYDHAVFENAANSLVDYSGSTFPVVVPAPAKKVVHSNPVATSYRTTTGITDTSIGLFNGSLEAHRRLYTAPGAGPELYWIGETHNNVRIGYERIRNYEQAELIFDGVKTLGDPGFRERWNKYNFFRIHNLNSEELVLLFPNSGAVGTFFRVAVDAYSSKCVRRNLTGGSYVASPVYEYTEGYRYFQKFRSGDARFYQLGATTNNLIETDTPGRLPNCNNVVNPDLLIRFVNQVLAGQPLSTVISATTPIFAPPTVVLDPHVHAPLPEGYISPVPVGQSQLLYADPADDSALLANCLHHKGIVLAKPLPAVDGQTGAFRISWPGYGQPVPLKADGTPALDIRTVGDEMQVKSNYPNTFLSVLSTNFICAYARYIGVPPTTADGYYRLTLTLPDPGLGFYKSFDSVNGSAQSFTFNRINPVTGALGTLVSVTSTPQLLYGSVAHTLAGIVPWRDRVFETKATLDGGHGSSFASTSLRLTGSGLVLQTTQTIPLSAPLTSNGTTFGDNTIFTHLAGSVVSVPFPAMVTAGARPHVTTDGTSIIIKRSIVFTNYGWPDTNRWLYTVCLSPRLTRVYGNVGVGSDGITPSPHPDFLEGLQNASGEEIVYVGDTSFIDSEVAILSPWNAPPALPPAADAARNQIVGVLNSDSPRFGVGSPTDGFYQATKGGAGNNGYGLFVRAPMDVESYNRIAAKVNSISKIIPLNFLAHAIFPWVLSDGTITNELSLRLRFTAGNSRGIFTDLVRGDGSYTYWSGVTQAQKLDYENVQTQQFAGLRPVDQYASFGQDTDTQYVRLLTAQCAALGVPVRGSADLPQWGAVATKRVKLAQSALLPVIDEIVEEASYATIGGGGQAYHIVRNHNLTFNTGPIFQWEESSESVRGDLAAITNYRWVKISDIKNAAESLGYKFTLPRFGPRFDLFVVSAEYGEQPSPITVTYGEEWYFPPPIELALISPAVNYPPWNPVTEFQILSIPLALDKKLVDFLPSVEGAWIAGISSSKINRQPIETDAPKAKGQFVVNVSATSPLTAPPETGNYSPVHNAGVISYNVAIDYDFNITLSDNRFRKVNWPTRFALLRPTLRNPADYCSANGILLVEADPSPANSLSAGLADNSVVIQSPTLSVDFTPDFSTTSAGAAIAVLANGPSVYPATVNPVGAMRLQLLSEFNPAGV